MSARGSVELTQVTRDFDDEAGVIIKAVDDVSLVLQPGKLCLLMGPSGSGKTTLLSILGGLIAPTSGEVKIDNQELGCFSQRELTAFRLKNIGIVYQAFHLINALNVLENVELPLTVAGIGRPHSQAMASALVDSLGLQQRQRFKPRALSGGEKQRTAIARALVNDPMLLLADEPTGSLDARAGEEVIKMLHREAVEKHRVVVIASHDERIIDYADQVLRMEYGEVVSQARGKCAV